MTTPSVDLVGGIVRLSNEPQLASLDTEMAQEIFYPDLNDFCRTYFISNRQVSPVEASLLPTRWNEQEAALFEQLMLFDKISFKVYGENILIPVLIRMLGLKGFEELIEQKAIGFTLWASSVTHLVTDVAGVYPLQFIVHNSPPHADPEASIMQGFKWMKERPSLELRRRLTRKIVPLYKIPSSDLSKDAVEIVHSAYRSGKLKLMGLDTEQDLGHLPLGARSELCKYAAELMEYSYLLNSRMTSFSNFHYYTLFNDSVSKVRTKDTLYQSFNSVASIECFPDLRSLRAELKIPLSKLPKLRHKRSSVHFRDWLATTTYSAGDVPITKEYIDAIADAKGFFETKKGKLTKSIAMTAVGTGIGALIAGAEGGVIGATTAKFLEPAADFALDMLDECLIGGLTKGWTPRMFFDDLRKISKPE